MVSSDPQLSTRKRFGKGMIGRGSFAQPSASRKLKTLLQAVHLAIPRSMLMSVVRIGWWHVLHCSCIVFWFLGVVESVREEREPKWLRLVLYRQFVGAGRGLTLVVLTGLNAAAKVNVVLVLQHFC